MVIVDAVAGLGKSVVDFFGKKQEVKAAAVTAEAKIKQARQDGDLQIQLTELEIQALDKKNQAGSWKDEYALVLGTLPYPLILIGGVVAAFGYPQFAAGVGSGLSSLHAIGVDVGFICSAAFAAGLGLRFVRR